MRPFFAIAALVAVRIGLGVWAFFGQAQPRGGSRPTFPDPFKPDRPAKAPASKAAPRPADDPYVDPTPRPPSVRTVTPEVTPAPGPK